MIIHSIKYKYDNVMHVAQSRDMTTYHKCPISQVIHQYAVWTSVLKGPKVHVITEDIISP